VKICCLATKIKEAKNLAKAFSEKKNGTK